MLSQDLLFYFQMELTQGEVVHLKIRWVGATLLDKDSHAVFTVRPSMQLQTWVAS